MREAVNLFAKCVNLIVGIACMIAAGAAFINEDPMHIPLAYMAASWMYMNVAQEDIF